MTTDRERGSATVWMLALTGVLAALSLAVVLVGVAVVARHRASAAADFSALAAASAAVTGRPDPCAVAARVAAANSAELASCVLAGEGVVQVGVTVPVRLGPLGVHSASACARAGPAPP